MAIPPADVSVKLIEPSLTLKNLFLFSDLVVKLSVNKGQDFFEIPELTMAIYTSAIYSMTNIKTLAHIYFQTSSSQR